MLDFSDGKKASFLALFLIFIGFLLIYFWPADLKYESVSIERAKISEEGQWVEISGTVKDVLAKQNGETVSICSESGNCVSTYFEEVYGMYYMKGLEVLIRGEISDVSGNKFLRGHEIEIVR